MNDYERVAKGELIGLQLEITESKNKSLKGMKGKIINETKNMLTIDTKYGIKKIIKSEVKMKLKTNNKEFDVDGNILIGRPEDRVKRIRGIK